MPKHRKFPPYPAWPAVRERRALLTRAAGVALVVTVFVGFFMVRAYLGLDRIEQHTDDVHRYEHHIER